MIHISLQDDYLPSLPTRHVNSEAASHLEPVLPAMGLPQATGPHLFFRDLGSLGISGFSGVLVRKSTGVIMWGCVGVQGFRG